MKDRPCNYSARIASQNEWKANTLTIIRYGESRGVSTRVLLAARLERARSCRCNRARHNFEEFQFLHSIPVSNIDVTDTRGKKIHVTLVVAFSLSRINIE